MIKIRILTVVKIRMIKIRMIKVIMKIVENRSTHYENYFDQKNCGEQQL